MKFLLTAISFTFVACSSKVLVSKPECSELNWFERGRQDGMQGQPSNNWTVTSRECQNMQRTEVQSYTDGWNHGLAMYCTEEHGFATAKAGIGYAKTCPDKYEQGFLKGYEEGLRVYLIEKETTEIIAEIDTIETRLKAQGLPPEDQATLKRDIQSLNQRKVSNLKALEKYNTSAAR